MAIPTIWTIEHSCGHIVDRDLSAKKAGDRAGFARWLGTKECDDCFVPGSSGEVSAEVEAERTKNLSDAIDAAERDALPSLTGSPKQTSWAVESRYNLIRDAYLSLVENGGMTDHAFDAQVITPARLIDKASWWIDNREFDPADLPELLADVITDDTASSTQNPY